MSECALHSDLDILDSMCFQFLRVVAYWLAYGTYCCVIAGQLGSRFSALKHAMWKSLQGLSSHVHVHVRVHVVQGSARFMDGRVA